MAEKKRNTPAPADTKKSGGAKKGQNTKLYDKKGKKPSKPASSVQKPSSGSRMLRSVAPYVFTVLALVLAMCLMATSALADIVICQNKVEITAAMQEYAAQYSEKTGTNVKVITGGGSSDYNTVLKAEMQSGKEPDIFVIEGLTHY